MSQNVTNLHLSAKFSDNPLLKYRGGKLFVGVLGVEYSIPYFQYLNKAPATIDLLTLPATGNPLPPSLQYSFIKRTADPEEFAFSDGVLPTYLRFQPDLGDPLTDAANNDTQCGVNYMSQYIDIEQPSVLVEGKIAVHNADGSISYAAKTISFTVPINPPGKRIIHLSLQSGLISVLASVR